MKKVLTLALIMLGAKFAMCQYDREFKPFKVDLSLGYAVPQGSGAKGGVLFAFEPKYAVMDQLAFGLRMEAAVMARALEKTDGEISEAEVKANASYLATADYYFNNNSFRPLVGAGLGLFRSAGVNTEDDLETEDIPVSNKFGFMVRAGFELGHFRTGFEYNFVGKQGDIKMGYLGIKLGVVFGGGRYE